MQTDRRGKVQKEISGNMEKKILKTYKKRKGTKERIQSEKMSRKRRKYIEIQRVSKNVQEDKRRKRKKE